MANEVKTWRGTHRKHTTVTVDLTDAEKASYENDPQTKGKYRFEPIPQPKAPVESKTTANKTEANPSEK